MQSLRISFATHNKLLREPTHVWTGVRVCQKTERWGEEGLFSDLIHNDLLKTKWMFFDLFWILYANAQHPIYLKVHRALLPTPSTKWIIFIKWRRWMHLEKYLTGCLPVKPAVSLKGYYFSICYSRQLSWMYMWIDTCIVNIQSLKSSDYRLMVVLS